MTRNRLFGREITRQFSTFILVGITCTVLNYLVFIVLLNFLNVNYLISAGAGFIIGVAFGFVFNKRATFESEKKHSSVILKYTLVYAFSLIFNLVFLHFMVEYLEMEKILSNMILAPFIVLINFIGTKLFAFENRKW